MVFENTKLLTCKSVYWVSINTDIEKHIKFVTHVLSFSKFSLKRRYYTITYHRDYGKC